MSLSTPLRMIALRCGLTLAAMSICLPAAQAQTDTSNTAAVKKPAKKAKA